MRSLGGPEPALRSLIIIIIIIIIIMAEMAVVLTWLATSLEEKRRWLVINASPRGQCSK